MIAVNVRGVFLGLKHVLPRMERGGAVVNTASTAGLIGAAGLVAYIASKHAVIGITRTVALECAERGIRVNAVCPGPVEGRMMTSLEDGMGGAAAHEAFLASLPLRRFARPRRGRLHGRVPALGRGGLLHGRALRARRRPDGRLATAGARPRGCRDGLPTARRPRGSRG